MKKQRKVKPRCGAYSQSCGFGCIASHLTCRARLDVALSKFAVQEILSHARTAKQLTELNVSDHLADLDFDTLRGKFASTEEGLLEAKAIVRHSDAITTQHVTLNATVGNGLIEFTLLKHDGKLFTVSDGFVKELPSDISNSDALKEGRDAALRAIVAKAKLDRAYAKELSRPKTEDFSIAPYREVSVLGEGAYGKAVVTDRGTVVKRLFGGSEASHSLNAVYLQLECDMLQEAHRIGIAPRPIGLSRANLELEMTVAKGEPLSNSIKLAPALRAQILSKLSMLHSKTGISHNDLHSGNIMYDEATDSAQFVDFGLAARYEPGDMERQRRNEMADTRCTTYRDLMQTARLLGTSGLPGLAKLNKEIDTDTKHMAEPKPQSDLDYQAYEEARDAKYRSLIANGWNFLE